jgi:hypothetical protein
MAIHTNRSSSWNQRDERKDFNRLEPQSTWVTRQLSLRLTQKFQSVTVAIAINFARYSLTEKTLNSKFTIKVCKTIPARQIMLNFNSRLEALALARLPLGNIAKRPQVIPQKVIDNCHFSRKNGAAS